MSSGAQLHNRVTAGLGTWQNFDLLHAPARSPNMDAPSKSSRVSQSIVSHTDIVIILSIPLCRTTQTSVQWSCQDILNDFYTHPKLFVSRLGYKSL